MAKWKGKIHQFATARSLQSFIEAPQLFEKATLPKKMPSPDLRPIYKAKA